MEGKGNNHQAVKVFIADDSPDVREQLEALLSDLKEVGIGEQAGGTPEDSAALQTLGPHAVILNMRMSDMDTCALCRSIRESSQIPTVVVTTKGDNGDKVQGLDGGGNGHITKLFSFKELGERFKAALLYNKLRKRRSEPAFRFRDMTINFNQKKVTLSGQEINLTATEYRLLAYLARNSGRLLTADQLLEKAWGREYIGETHLLQVNISRLRQKLKDDPRNPRYILTKTRIGYTMTNHIRGNTSPHSQRHTKS